MSFGYAVGDVIAILNLLERVAVEIRNYRDAPRHFQQLGAELYLVQRTLQRLLQIEPIGEEDVGQIEQIRAVAIHCHQPLQAFVNKMRPSEKSLGHVQSSGTLSTIGRRLHWSLITKNDVDELRKVIMSEMVTINMLLGMQQLSSLRRLQAGADPTMYSEVKQLCTQSQSFLDNSTHVFDNLVKLPEDLAGLQATAAEQTIKQTHASAQIIGHLDAISSSSSALVCQGNTTVTTLGHLETRVSRSISALISIALDVKEILRRLQSFSRDFSEMMLANGRKLLDIHAMIKRLVRAVEAIPLHLTLAIVRLDDALGESWALPYQACQTLECFEQILKNVVFANGRPGAGHVELGRFVIRSNKDGALLNTHTWKSAVKEGAHLTQAMVVSRAKASPRRCLFADCIGALQSDADSCPICGRSSSLETRTTSLLGLTTTSQNIMNMASSAKERRIRKTGIFGPLLPDVSKLERDDIKDFRNIHLIRMKAPIKSVTEAEEILKHDQRDPQASKYLGWHLLQSKTEKVSTTEAAIAHLKRSITYDQTQLESHYLLGRAFMKLSHSSLHHPPPSLPGQFLPQAYNAYQQAVYVDGNCNTVWISIALLYMMINQYRDSLDALSRSIRLNPYEPLAWRNLGVLYDHCNHQELDAIDAYTRAFELGLDDSQCLDRLNALRQYTINGTLLPPLRTQMKDFDLRTANYDTHELDEHGHIEIAGLRLDEDLDLVDSGGESDDWETSNDD